MRSFGRAVAIMGVSLMGLFGSAASAGDNVEISNPNLFPHPLKATDQAIEMGPVTIAVPNGEDRLKSAAGAWAKTMAKQTGKPVHVSFGPASPDDTKELGDQGYTLVVRPVELATSIDIQATSEEGRFLGLQTLKQLVNGGRLHVVQIQDHPTLSRRGVPAGGWWWRNRERLIPMYAELKLNYIYAGGEMVDGKFGGPEKKSLWREPFTEKELSDLKDCLELAHRNFIDISLQMCPRGEPPVTYCSDEDINLNVAKMSKLYDIGYRKFGINFDDLQNIGQNKIITDADKAKFGDDLGEAHRYFVEQVYTRFKANHPDIEFSFCPLYYSGFTHMGEKGQNYLKAAGKLPKEIQLVTCPESAEETAMVSEWTGRPQLIWDNQIADRSGTFVTPLERTDKYTDKDIKGYLTLLSQGDPFKVGYSSMADYMWSPERYDPRAAERAAYTKALGSSEAAAAVRSYIDATARLEAMKYPMTDKQARYDAMKADLEAVRQATAKIAEVLPSKSEEARGQATTAKADKFDPAKAAEEAKSQTASLSEMVETLKARMDSQPFPVKVARIEPGKIVPANDVAAPSSEWSKATVLTDFLALRSGKSAAVQTKAQILHDGEWLYVRVVCDEPNPAGIVAKAKSGDEPVYEDDSVELFFITNPEKNNSRQIVVNTLNALFGGVKCDVATKVGTDQWVAEFAIPLKSLGVDSVKPGDVWRFNVARSRYQVKGDAHSSWSPLFSRGFNVPAKFWPMIFE